MSSPLWSAEIHREEACENLTVRCQQSEGGGGVLRVLESALAPSSVPKAATPLLGYSLAASSGLQVVPSGPQQGILPYRLLASLVLYFLFPLVF